MRKLLSHESNLTVHFRIYKRIHRFFNVYMTHLPSFVPFRVLVRVYWQSRFKFLFVPSKNHFHFFFRILRGPLLRDADIYTSTLILYNSLNYNLIDTKLGTILHLLFFYHYSELHGQNCLYQYCTALC